MIVENNIQYAFTYPVKVDELRAALTSGEKIKKWWTPQADLLQQVGAVGTFSWPKQGWTIKVLQEKIEENYVQWHCTDSNMQNSDAWIGTKMKFKLIAQGSKTKLLFSQENYQDSKCRGACDEGWKHSLGTSLRSYLETGNGKLLEV